MTATIHLHGWDWFYFFILLAGFFLMGMGLGSALERRR